MIIPALLAHRQTLIGYMRMKLEEEDWHGVCDAANDLREVDVEIRIRREKIERE